MLKKISLAVSLLLSFSLLSTSAWADKLVLSPPQQAYLQQHPVISLCVDPNWLPYEKLTEQGDYIGLVAQYISLFESRLGIKMDVVKTDNWQQSQQLYQTGGCDLVSALNKTIDRSRYLNFTQAYIESPAVLVLNESNVSDEALVDLAGKSLAMVSGYVYESRLQQQYPGIQVIPVTNMEEALQKVATGEVDATIGPLFLSFALTQELGLANLKIVGNTEYRDAFRIGVQKSNVSLLRIMEQAVASLTPEDHSQLRQDWAKQR